ncbi:MAG: sulfotransferase [Gammaproteobacteria bacterium]|nr:sulfotransferase [Gammaproteobacteria bacterium]MBU1446713.1 sulfotransferase [Gammaproteobacteria bacterium]
MLSYGLFEGRPLTTRGQWINPLVFAHFALEKHLPRLRRVEKPVFILGTGRSGTTVLGMVLSMHREVGFLNEPKALWHAIHPEEDLIGSYARGAAKYRLGADEATPQRIRHAHRLFGAYLVATFSRRVVDKYPELIFRVPFVKAIFPDAKFLFLVRNGWDTCHSIEGWSNRLGEHVGGEQHDWWGVNRRKWDLLIEQLVVEYPDLAVSADEMRTWTKHTDMAAVEWIITMREGMSLMERYPADVVRVDYEQLCEKPSESLAGMLKFLELSDDDKFLQYGIETLKPTVKRSPFILQPTIANAFNETMMRLGYVQTIS